MDPSFDSSGNFGGDGQFIGRLAWNDFYLFSKLTVTFFSRTPLNFGTQYTVKARLL